MSIRLLCETPISSSSPAVLVRDGGALAWLPLPMIFLSVTAIPGYAMTDVA